MKENYKLCVYTSLIWSLWKYYSMNFITALPVVYAHAIVLNFPTVAQSGLVMRKKCLSYNFNIR